MSIPPRFERTTTGHGHMRVEIDRTKLSDEELENVLPGLSPHIVHVRSLNATLDASGESLLRYELELDSPEDAAALNAQAALLLGGAALLLVGGEGDQAKVQEILRGMLADFIPQADGATVRGDMARPDDFDWFVDQLPQLIKDAEAGRATQP